MIGVFRGQFRGVWSGGVRVTLRGFPDDRPGEAMPDVWVVAVYPSTVVEELRAIAQGVMTPRPSVRGLQITMDRLNLAYPADNYGPLEGDVTGRWTDRWGREWLQVTLYVEDRTAWLDRWRDDT